MKQDVPGRIPFDLVTMSIIFLFVVLAVRPSLGFVASHLCGWVVVTCLWGWSQYLHHYRDSVS
eukprot:TRINITY_DN4077_c0_g1_i1.p4 TRINITY_DN4077_c0_g1~~TRINITY_DN4077_c0_g1_i1.p4  ORF type:complete len:63 (+),score=6.05 TRINITY_DN4077_c0_g1_i1:1081-1269(+)